MTYSFVSIRSLVFVRSYSFVVCSSLRWHVDVFVCVFVVALGRSLIHLSIFPPFLLFVRPFIHLSVCLLVHPTPDRSITSPFTHLYTQALMFCSAIWLRCPYPIIFSVGSGRVGDHAEHSRVCFSISLQPQQPG